MDLAVAERNGSKWYCDMAEVKWPLHWTSERPAVSHWRAFWVSSRPYVHTRMLTVGRAHERKRRARLQKELWSLAEGPGVGTLNGTDGK